MQNLLAIETSGNVCAVGLVLDGTRLSRCEHVAKRHNERLLPMLDELAREAGLSHPALVARLAAVAFGRGPGSFTGVRIAAAAAQAIALAGPGRVLRVSSSEVIAQRALAGYPHVPGVLTSIRSRRDLHYIAAYRNDSGVAVCSVPDVLLSESPDPAFYARHEGWLVAGETPSWWSGAAPVPCDVDAHALLSVAVAALERGEDVDAASGLPEYIEGDSPWRGAGP